MAEHDCPRSGVLDIRNQSDCQTASLSALAPGKEKVDKNGMKACKNLSRRTFLKTTAAVTSAAPLVLPSRIWAAEVKPNDRLTLGFIGLGTQGRGLMGGFLGKKETQTIAV